MSLRLQAPLGLQVDGLCAASRRLWFSFGLKGHCCPGRWLSPAGRQLSVWETEAAVPCLTSWPFICELSGGQRHLALCARECGHHPFRQPEGQLLPHLCPPRPRGIRPLVPSLLTKVFLALNGPGQPGGLSGKHSCGPSGISVGCGQTLGRSAVYREASP